MFDNYLDILTIHDVCELLYIGKTKVYELLRSGELHGFKTGKLWRIEKAEVVAFINRNRNISTK